MSIKKLFYPLWILSLCACQNVPNIVATSANKPVPALLTTNNTGDCYQQLSLRLTEALNHPVQLTSSVFSGSSTWSLSSAVIRDADGIRKDGLLLDKPNAFRLELVNQECVITQINKQWQSVLPLCLCQAVKQ